jgi:hypothetical protein
MLKSLMNETKKGNTAQAKRMVTHVLIREVCPPRFLESKKDFFLKKDKSEEQGKTSVHTAAKCGTQCRPGEGARGRRSRCHPK